MPPEGDVHLVQSAVPTDGIPPGSTTDTTTISTIAVKAGEHATIVVALLRSMGYVELRIDEMRPGLLAIGGSVDETRHLLAIHEDIMHRLREKEDQVEVLLTRADNLAHEKEDPNEQIVYEAMAKSLNTAWRELLKQLHLRGYLLDDCLNFYMLANKHQQLCGLLARGGPNSGLVMNDLIDLTAQAIDLGSSVIAQIRTLGLINDNEQRPREILASCEVIERILLRMALEWERIEAAKEQILAQQVQQPQQQQPPQQSQAEENALKQIEEWLSRAERRVVAANDFGLSVLLNEAAEQLDRLDSIRSFDQSRVDEVRSKIRSLVERIHKRLNSAQRIQQFYGASNSMSAQLDMMEQDMRNANAAMAGELAPLARQKASVVIGEGRNILGSEKLTYEEQRTINLRVNDLETKLRKLEELAEQRSHESQNRSSQLVSELSQWLQQSAEPFMAQNGDLGATQHDGARFASEHKNFAQTIINQESAVQQMYQQGQELNEADRRTVHEFERRYDTLKRQLEERIHLGQTFEQVHKFSQELQGSFGALSSLLDSNQGGINENVSSQMNNVFQMIQETLGQERQQGERFISRAQHAATNDRALKVDRAIESVKKVLVEHESRFSEITQKWSQWEANKTASKKQQNVVEEIQIWQEEVIEIIGLLENTHISSSKESEGLRRRVHEIKDTMDQQTQRLEEIKKTTQDSQTLHQIESTQQRQQYIEDKLKQLERKVNTIHETLIEEEIREVVKAPEILAPLKETTVNEGSRFEFAARIEAEPEPTICWLKDGVDVKQNVDYHTEFVNGVATLTIEETFVEDSALYTVRAANRGGTVESSARLNVISRSQADQSLAEGKPHFVRQLQNVVSIEEGEDLRLECVIVGKPEPEVLWLKEDQSIREDQRTRLEFLGDRCALQITSTNLQDTGLYTVKARNSLGEASNFSRVQVTQKAKPAPPPTPPKPTSRPSSRASKPPAIQPTLTNNTYREGDQVKLQVYITGEPRPRVQWTFNDRPIITSQQVRIENEETGWSRLIIDSVRPEHAGIYTVFAENEAGEARTGASMHVTPSQRIESVDESIHKSSVTVQHTGIPHKEVTRVLTEGYWTDGQLTGSPTPPPIPRHGNQEINQSSIRIEEYGEQDLNEIGFSSIATEPEFIRPFLKEYTVNEGEKIRIECLMVGAPRPKVNWYHNDRNINLSQGFVDLSNVGDTYAIVINQASLHHAGYFKMIAENCRGKTESITVLHVRPREMVMAQEEFERQQKMMRRTQSPAQSQPRPSSRGSQGGQEHREDRRDEYEIEQQRRAQGQPPHFTQTLVSAVAAQGEDARFEGVVTGWPAPEIEWTKDGEVISRQTHPDINFSAIGGRVCLSIAESAIEHAGKYMCTARNTSGVATSSAQLVVRPKTIAPDFIQRLISEEVVEGDQLKWTVRVTGDPQPKVTWLRDGVVIPDCEEVRIVEEGDGVHTLLIVRVEMADCGQFTCLAENIAGEARSTADLVVRPPGADPGNYFHVTKVTQERQVKGEEPQIDQAFAIENPATTTTAPSNFI